MQSFARYMLRLSQNIQYSTYLPIKEYMDELSMRIVFVGAEKSGTKTSFISRYAAGTFSDDSQKDFAAPQKKRLVVNGAVINVELIDVPNPKHMGSLKYISGVVVGYNSASRQSLEATKAAYGSIREVFPRATVMVVGGMSDKKQASEECVDEDEGRSFAKSIGTDLFFESNNNNNNAKRYSSFFMYIIHVLCSIIKNGR